MVAVLNSAGNRLKCCPISGEGVIFRKIRLMPDIVDPQMEAYCTRWTTPVPDVLKELDRETHLTTIYPQMLTGPWQGRFLTLLTQMLRPKRILEVGTFTGYSAICFAMGLPPGAVIETIEVNEEKEPLIRKYIEKAGVTDKVILHIGSALDVIPTLEGPFDMVFLDAHKPDYPRYYELVFDKLNPGAVILADNVLWSGKVLLTDQDEDTVALDAFNRMVAADPRVEQVILPLRDGLLMARKLG